MCAVSPSLIRHGLVSVERVVSISWASCIIWNTDNLFVCDNVHTDYVSALVAVCIAYCALQIVLFTLHYITSKGADINMGTSKIVARWSRTTRGGTSLTRYKHAPPHVGGLTCRLWSLLVKRYKVGLEIGRKTGLIASRLSKSLKVIGTETDRSASWQYLTFYGNHFQDVAKCWQKIIVKFSKSRFIWSQSAHTLWTSSLSIQWPSKFAVCDCVH